MWRKDVRDTLRDDHLGYLGRTYSAVSRNISDTFPDVDIIGYYVNPVTTMSLPAAEPRTTHNLDSQQQPDISRLASMCFHKFGWSPKDIFMKFEELIFPGALIKMLCQVCLLDDGACEHSI